MHNVTCCIWINSLGEVETQLHNVTEQAIWLKKVILSMESSFDLFDFDWFGSIAPKYTPNIGNYPVYSFHNNSPGVIFSQKI